jgi:hypothetical protein
MMFTLAVGMYTTASRSRSSVSPVAWLTMRSRRRSSSSGVTVRRPVVDFHHAVASLMEITFDVMATVGGTRRAAASLRHADLLIDAVVMTLAPRQHGHA